MLKMYHTYLKKNENASARHRKYIFGYINNGKYVFKDLFTFNFKEFNISIDAFLNILFHLKTVPKV